MKEVLLNFSVGRDSLERFGEALSLRPDRILAEPGVAVAARLGDEKGRKQDGKGNYGKEQSGVHRGLIGKWTRWSERGIGCMSGVVGFLGTPSPSSATSLSSDLPSWGSAFPGPLHRVEVDEDFAWAGAVFRADDATVFEIFHQSGGTVVSNAQAPLKHRRRGSLGGTEYVQGLG